MADTKKDSDKKGKGTLKISSPGKLSLTKTVESGNVQQKFTHGRSKNVTVEVRRTRTYKAGSKGAMEEVKPLAGGKDAPGNKSAVGADGLTEEERQARLKVLENASENTASTSTKLAHQELEEQEDKPVRAKSKDGVVTSPILEKQKEEKAQKSQKATARPKPADPSEVQAAEAADSKKAARKDDSERDKLSKGKLKLKAGRGEKKVTTGKLSLSSVLSGEEGGRSRSLASIRRQREKVLKQSKQGGASSSGPQEKVIREVTIPETITVQELANRMSERSTDVIKELMKLGMMVTVTQSIDADTAELVVGELGHTFKRVAESDVENVLIDDGDDDPATLKPRPPVVTIMGHVDHGKTSLLDALRQTDVVAKEAGGITQHIGAYQVQLDKDKGSVTFLDTPGHEAFTAMRARGAKVTDIVILVVAADDGIKAQTEEAISHAKAAEVPIIVAINKMDKPEADVDRVKNELMSHELIPEDFGGDIQCIEVSAKEKTNLDKLLDAVLLQAEILELKANPDRAANGVVVEARLDTGRGIVATLLLQKGTLKVGDIVVAGPAYGRVRSLLNDKNQVIDTAGPGAPVEILGLNLAPDAGDIFSVVEDEKTAREITEYREKKVRDKHAGVLAARSIDQMFVENKGVKDLAVIIKGDVQGSVEAICGSITKLEHEEVNIKILHTGVGALSESDVTLAKATGASIIAFNVRATPKAREEIQADGLDVRYYSVIYDVVNDIKAAISGLLSPVKKENFLGYAEIREVFNMSKAGKVAGCFITEGMVKRGAKVRLLRDNVVIHEGTLKTLRRFKDEVKEVKNGFDCGMAFENYDDIRVGDQIEAFEIEEVARTID